MPLKAVHEVRTSGRAAASTAAAMPVATVQSRPGSLSGMDVAAMTLDSHLDVWLELLRTRVQPTTYRSYDDMIHSCLRPVLGSCRVGELTANQLNLHFVHLLQQGGRRGGPLERSTVKYAHTILRQVLGEAVRDGLLDDNVAARSAPPRHVPDRDLVADRLRTWDRAEATRFLELAAGQPLHGLWRLALGTGMRRGELLGLTWEDVDLEVQQVRVRTSLIHGHGRPQLKSTKSGRGRVLALDADTATIGRAVAGDSYHHRPARHEAHREARTQVKGPRGVRRFERSVVVLQ